jgi:4-cresol dehydrogenase (hydroxylating)
MKLQVAAARQRIRQALRGKVRRLRFLDDRALEFGERIKRPYRWLTGVDIGEMLKLVRPVYALMKGVPTDELIASTYWRKRATVPAQADPDRDRCGLLWCSPVSPTEGRHARAMADIVRDVFSAYPFEPAMSMTLINERSLDNVICISYDRDVEGEDVRAMQCYHELSDRLAKAGYYSYRLGIHSTTPSPLSVGHSSDLVTRIRQLIDPNHILAPGRYE